MNFNEGFGQSVHCSLAASGSVAKKTAQNILNSCAQDSLKNSNFRSFYLGNDTRDVIVATEDKSTSHAT